MNESDNLILLVFVSGIILQLEKAETSSVQGLLNGYPSIFDESEFIEMYARDLLHSLG
jgi:hypothetical protein